MNKTLVLSFYLLVGSTVLGQTALQVNTVDVQGTVVGGEGGDVQVFSFAPASDSVGVVLEAPISGDFVPAATFASPFMPHDMLGIASSPQFMEELGILDDQREQLVNLNRTISKARNEMIKSIHVKQKEHMAKKGGKPEPFNPGKYIREQEEQFKAQIQDGVGEILLPHQVKRLEELEVQMKIKSGGARAVAGDLIANALDLTDEQRKELREKEREAQRELNKKIAKLREEARESVLKEVLTDEQQEKLAQLTGEKFEVKRPERRSRVRAPSKQFERNRASRKRDAEKARRKNSR